MKRIVFSFFLAAMYLSSCSDVKDPNQPNVIIILVDDLGWTDLACYSSDYHQTPHIDQLASEGVLFTNSYSACTVCSPTRASVMTGKYPARLHLTDWIEGHKYPWARMNVPDWKMYLDTAELTLAEVFRNAGYFTAHVGKWHLGKSESNWPEYQGFDVNIAGWASGAPLLRKDEGYTGYFSPYGNPRLSDGPAGEYLTERLAGEVSRLIKEHANERFFINFWLYNVHTPLQASEQKINKYNALTDASGQHQNPVYAAMVEHTDDAVGRVVAQLKESGLYENTIILFSSDNGGLVGKQGNRITNNYPLREGKGGMYEGGVRIPTILYAPTVNKVKKVIDEPVISPDYYPTLLELAGIAVPQNPEMDGVSWMPLLQGEAALLREAIFWHYPHYHQQGAVPYSAVRSGDWKLIENLETGESELYNLQDDIGETQNLVMKYPDVAAQMRDMLNQWRTESNVQFPSINDDYDAMKARNKR